MELCRSTVRPDQEILDCEQNRDIGENQGRGVVWSVCGSVFCRMGEGLWVSANQIWHVQVTFLWIFLSQLSLKESEAERPRPLNLIRLGYLHRPRYLVVARGP